MRSILYYPYISVRDGEWLRNAILYWDEICTIVPSVEFSALSPELQYLESVGCYRPIVPKDVFTLGKPREFAEAATRYFNNGFSREDYPDYFQNRQTLYDPSLHSLLHYRKLPTKTIDLLLSHGIQPDRDGWITMPTTTAINYMKLLAEFAAKYDKADMVVGTDSIRHLRQLYPNRAKYNRNEALSVVFNNCFPIPSADVGYEELLDFKRQRKDELSELWEKIRELETTISNSQDIFQIKSELLRFRNSWEQELERSTTLFTEKRIPLVFGSLRAFISGAGAAQTIDQLVLPEGFLSSPTAIAATVGAGLIGVGKYYLDYKKRIAKASHASGFAYIVSANRHGLIRSKSQLEILY